MSKVVFISKRKIQWYIVLAALIVICGAYYGWQRTQAASVPPSDGARVIELVTGEFKATTDDGKTLESYRWDPGNVYLRKGEPVELRITGINGQSHPFVIEGLNVSGEVHKGKTTVVRFTPKNAGIYPIICQTHTDPKNGGPMVGYIIVQ
jgi:heme/copper-type cytochrome/quinol oxidase subunit 2